MVIGRVACTANGKNVRLEKTNNYCSKKERKKRKKEEVELRNKIIDMPISLTQIQRKYYQR